MTNITVPNFRVIDKMQLVLKTKKNEIKKSSIIGTLLLSYFVCNQNEISLELLASRLRLVDLHNGYKNKK